MSTWVPGRGESLLAQDGVLKQVGTHHPLRHCDHINLKGQAGKGILQKACSLPGFPLGLPQGKQRGRGLGWGGGGPEEAERQPGLDPEGVCTQQAPTPAYWDLAWAWSSLCSHV